MTRVSRAFTGFETVNLHRPTEVRHDGEAVVGMPPGGRRGHEQGRAGGDVRARRERRPLRTQGFLGALATVQRSK
jgi:hypothetical protein